MFKEILEFNKDFVKNKEYLKYKTDKFPSKNIAILTCMDTRLTHLLPAALNLSNGDVKLIKNAGALITRPYGSVMRSLVVAIHELGVNEIIVIGHLGCGMNSIDHNKLEEKIINSSVGKKQLDEVKKEIDLTMWLEGFDDDQKQIKDTVDKIKKHKLIPKEVEIHGCLMNPKTGELKEII